MALINITKNPFSEPISGRFQEQASTTNGAFVEITKSATEKELDVFDIPSIRWKWKRRRYGN